MPDRELRARLAAIEAEILSLVGPVTMHTATHIDVNQYKELYIERESLLHMIRLENEHESSMPHEEGG
jgi:hypothetical protein